MSYSNSSEPRRWGRRAGVVLLYVLIDAVAAFFTFYFIYLARFAGRSLFKLPPDLFQIDLFSTSLFRDHFEVAALMGLFLLFLMYKNGLYETARGRRFSEELGAVAQAAFLTLIFGLTVSFLMQQFIVSRLVISAFALAMVPVLGGWRYLKRRWLEYLIAQGYRRTRALIVGAGKAGRYLESSLRDRPELGVDVVGFLDDRATPPDKKRSRAPIVGSLAEFARAALEHDVQEVYVTIPSERAKVKCLIEQAYELGMSVHIVPDVFDLLMREVSFESIGSLTLLQLYRPTLSGWERWVKRMEDLVFGSALLFIFSPLIAVIALAVKLDSEGPVFYRQRRHGRNGGVFWLYKFRSMYQDADESKHREYAKQLIRSNDPPEEEGIYKLTRDERITRVGRVIRKFNLDEIPQLFNVVRGEMSLIGPRPPLPYEYEEYKDYHKKRLVIKPGITGLWQVSGLHKLPFDEMVRLDLRYINEWSVWLDLEILLRTIPVVLFGKGR